MKISIYIFFILGLLSCNWSSKKQVLIEEEPIDFTNVDAFPLFDACDQLASRQVQRDCFYQLLSKHIKTALKNEHITLLESPSDTIQVKIHVSSKGIISIVTISSLDTIKFNGLQKAILNSITKLPQVLPAIKTGIPVNSTYTLPIVVLKNTVIDSIPHLSE